MTVDIQTAKTNLPADKEQFVMKVGDKVYTDKKETGTALVEMCKEMKTLNVPATGAPCRLKCPAQHGRKGR